MSLTDISGFLFTKMGNLFDETLIVILFTNCYFKGDEIYRINRCFGLYLLMGGHNEFYKKYKNRNTPIDRFYIGHIINLYFGRQLNNQYEQLESSSYYI